MRRHAQGGRRHRAGRLRRAFGPPRLQRSIAYGAIYIDRVANQAVKCNNCTRRVNVGLEPACVSTCPSEALYFGDLNNAESKVSKMKRASSRRRSQAVAA
ncbi:MAG: 4Fe-4S dicluster domain-containing protein [Planctomycetota bacterium]